MMEEELRPKKLEGGGQWAGRTVQASGERMPVVRLAVEREQQVRSKSAERVNLMCNRKEPGML